MLSHQGSLDCKCHIFHIWSLIYIWRIIGVQKVNLYLKSESEYQIFIQKIEICFNSRLLAYRVDSNSVEIVKKVIIILEVKIHFPILSERAGSSISPI